MSIQHLCGAYLFFIVCFCPGLCFDCNACQSDTETNEVANQNEGKDSLPIARRPQTKFLRLQTDEFNNPIALQTATAKYVLKNDKDEVQFEVSLESVIHIADASYFRGFEKRFQRYDAVLYESLIKLKEAELNENELPSGFQIFRQVSTGTLGLAYQFEEVDYNAQNMRNADLSPNEIAERIESLGDNKTTVLIDLLAHIAQKVKSDQPNENAAAPDAAKTVERPNTVRFDFSILTDPDGIMKIRRIMATLLVNSQLLESPFPPSIHQLLIGDRNDRAMSILQDEFKKGKRRIAISFGVGHMADFEKRLVEEHGMELSTVNWRNAWDLRDGAIEGAPLEGLIESTFRDSFKNKLRQLAKGLHDKPEAANSDKSIDSEKDDKIKAMEHALKALEARLEEMERQTNEKDKNKSGNSDSPGNENQTKGDDASSLDQPEKKPKIDEVGQNDWDSPEGNRFFQQSNYRPFVRPTKIVSVFIGSPKSWSVNLCI